MLRALKNLFPQVTKNYYHLLFALVAAILYRFPARKLTVIGVTGTDGKTTTVSMIYHILSQSGKKVGMVSTVKTVINGQDFSTGLHVTTPSSFTLQRFLRKMVDSGSKFAVVEMTSHAIDQNRVAFIPVHTSVITNITPEHLDYHQSFEKYVAAKSKILKHTKYRILNIDDSSFSKLRLSGSGQLYTFGLKDTADFRAKDVAEVEDGLHFKLLCRNRQKSHELSVKIPIVGRFNVYNGLAALCATKALEIETQQAVSALSNFSGVAGRMQIVDEGQDFFVFVDFAHTPAAIEAVLKSLKFYHHNKLIAIFGAPGERDRLKRPTMGKISVKLADYSIFTADDPRSEDPKAIIEQIAQGGVAAGGLLNQNFWKIPDRGEAINLGIKNLAKEGDIVVVLGMGHEDTINIAGKEVPWSDEQTARKALRERLVKV